MKIGVLASGGGSNLQSIINACQHDYIPESKVTLVISNKKDAYALERARKHNIESIWIRPPLNMKKLQKGGDLDEILADPVRQEYDSQIKKTLLDFHIDVLCMAGYMLFVTPILLDNWDVINIHPALLPAFAGMHGVQDAWDYGTRVIGCTTHFADNKMDHGPIILQATTPVFPGEDPKVLGDRNLRREHLIYPESLRLYQQGLLKRKGRKVTIEWDEAHYWFHQQLLELWRNDFHDYYNSRQ
ncbi:MAG: phosphoribosylglycinamide formyltransferase [Candidatus Heimdallarchaeota archaeon]